MLAVVAATRQACTQESAPVENVRLSLAGIGFDGAYKLGCWVQIAVRIECGGEPFTGIVEATTNDADGVPATVATPTDHPLRVAAGSSEIALVFVRKGQDGAPLALRAVDRQGRERGVATLVPGRAGDDSPLPAGLPATNRLVVSLGAREDLAAPLVRADDADLQMVAVRSLLLADAAQLPTAWYGYESVDTVILSGSQPKVFDNAAVLGPRIEALGRWVELGGRLVMFCGAASATELIGEDGPLAPLVPGRFTGALIPVPDLAPLEVFSGAAYPLPRSAGVRFRVPQIADATGRLVAAGPGDLPLVIRARRGLGEITFVAFDPDAPPFADWSERTGLLRQALKWPAGAVGASRARQQSRAISADLVNQLRSALDQRFSGVATTHFAWVACLVLLYAAIIGPGDFFLLRRLGRMHWTWITFPLAVIGASAAAYALAYAAKGRDMRVNQVEIVDVDVAAGQARGTVITHMFNPRVARFDLALEPRFAANFSTGPSPSDLKPQASSLESPATLIAWLGVPGFGLGAMHGQRGQLAPFDHGYRFDPALDELHDLPIEQWSTKSLIGRWSGTVDSTIDAELEAVGDDQLKGRVVNRTGVRLEDCVLMRGGWAYALAPMDDGAAATIDEGTAARTLKTVLTSATAGDDVRRGVAGDQLAPFDALSTDVARIVKLMMFYESIGGAAYAGVPNRYLSFLDLSRLLRGDQAILLARAPAAAGSQWYRGRTSARGDKGTPLAGRDDRHWIYYRFVIPITAEESSDEQPQQPVFGPSPLPLR